MLDCMFMNRPNGFDGKRVRLFFVWVSNLSLDNYSIACCHAPLSLHFLLFMVVSCDRDTLFSMLYQVMLFWSLGFQKWKEYLSQAMVRLLGVAVHQPRMPAKTRPTPPHRFQCGCAQLCGVEVLSFCLLFSNINLFCFIFIFYFCKYQPILSF